MGDFRPVASPVQVPGYTVIRELGRGGQAIVYLAMQLSTGQQVALKVLLQGPFDDTRIVKRFKREVSALVSLNHPNIVTVLDTGQTADGHHFLVMNYIEGGSLDEYMRHRRENGTADLAQELAIFRKICLAVQAAHSRKIMHRDLKPSNIRIDRYGEPHLLDFGLARSARDKLSPGVESVSVTGDFLGSLPWSSPEQAEGVPEAIDHRTDIYSLGIILYQMLTGGRFPYEVDGHAHAVLNNIVSAEPTPPSKAIAAALAKEARSKRRPASRPPKPPDRQLERIVLKALAKKPADRQASAGQLAEEIAGYLSNRPAPTGPSIGRQVAALVLNDEASIRARVFLIAAIAILFWAAGYQSHSVISPADASRSPDGMTSGSQLASTDTPQSQPASPQGGNPVAAKPPSSTQPSPQAMQGPGAIAASAPATGPSPVDTMISKASPSTEEARKAEDSSQTTSIRLPMGWTIAANNGATASLSQRPGAASNSPLCVAMATGAGGGKVAIHSQVLNGVKLADITTLDFEAYISSASTSGDATWPYFNLHVDLDGNGTCDVKLASYPSSFFPRNSWTVVRSTSDQWRYRRVDSGTAANAWSPSQNFRDIVRQFPNATILVNPDEKSFGEPWSVGLLVGSSAGGGWSGFQGYVDNIRIGVKGEITRVDLQPLPASAVLAPKGSTRLARESAKPKLQTSDARTPDPGHVITNEFGMKLAYVPPGQLTLSVPEGQARQGTKPPTIVTFAKGFRMGITHVTQAQWREVMGSLPPYLQLGDALPVHRISFYDAQEFCEQLSRKTGFRYRMPSSEEWEYAGRAGATGDYGGSGVLDEMGWYSGNSGNKLHEVATKRPNAWGLYDIHGNLFQWCDDRYLSERRKANVDPLELSLDGMTSIRGGGGAYSGPEQCKFGYRLGNQLNRTDVLVGLRVVMEDADGEGEREATGPEPKGLLPKAITNSIGMKLVGIPAGKAWLGGERYSEGYRTLTTFGQGLFMGATHVTQGEWKALMGDASTGLGPDASLPVSPVRHVDAAEFCRRLSRKENRRYRLPTSAEIEYAARAGTSIPGGGAGTVDEMSWVASNSAGKVHAVATKRANPWGLYDMSGNVWQWCYYGTAPLDAYEFGVDPRGLEPPMVAAIRGGAFNIASVPSTDERFLDCSSKPTEAVGFRIVLDESSSVSNGMDRPASMPASNPRTYLPAGTPRVIENSVGMKLAYIPSGEFKSKGRQPVRLSNSFRMSVIHVTRSQWKAVMGDLPRNQTANRLTDDLPVWAVNWYDVNEFCERLSVKEKKSYRLPTVWEWEYAARAGATGNYGGSGIRSEMGERCGWDRPLPPGARLSNAWGLYDMQAYLRHWCSGSRYIQSKSADVLVDPSGALSGNMASICGEAFLEDNAGSPLYRTDVLFGFRVVLDEARPPTSPLKVARDSPPNPPPALPEAPAGVQREFTNFIGMKLAFVPSGKFLMFGDPEWERYAPAPIQVTITKGFHMGTTPVTQSQWRTIMGTMPNQKWTGDNIPVHSVSWKEVQEFCRKLGERDGRQYRLPTSAEWEYSCRAGTIGTYGGTGILSEMGWYRANSGGQLHQVATKRPNAWGLYDMHGNAWQWCAGGWIPNVHIPQILSDPVGQESETSHIVRGGSFDSDPDLCRSAHSSTEFTQQATSRLIGFRVVAELQPAPAR